MMVGIKITFASIIVSYLLFHYIFLSQSPSLANAQRLTQRDLSNTFRVHVLALADVLSDVGFVITTFIVWKGPDSMEKDIRVPVIRILSTIGKFPSLL